MLSHGRYFVSQSDVKPKQIVTRLRKFSRASRQLHVLASILIGSLDCLFPLWLARVMNFALVLRHSFENKLYWEVMYDPGIFKKLDAFVALFCVYSGNDTLSLLYIDYNI